MSCVWAAYFLPWSGIACRVCRTGKLAEDQHWKGGGNIETIKSERDYQSPAQPWSCHFFLRLAYLISVSVRMLRSSGYLGYFFHGFISNQINFGLPTTVYDAKMLFKSKAYTNYLRDSIILKYCRKSGRGGANPIISRDQCWALAPFLGV